MYAAMKQVDDVIDLKVCHIMVVVLCCFSAARMFILSLISIYDQACLLTLGDGYTVNISIL